MTSQTERSLPSLAENTRAELPTLTKTKHFKAWPFSGNVEQAVYVPEVHTELLCGSLSFVQGRSGLCTRQIGMVKAQGPL